MAMGTSISPPLISNSPTAALASGCLSEPRAPRDPACSQLPRCTRPRMARRAWSAGDFNGDGKQDLMTTIYIKLRASAYTDVYSFLRQRGRHAEGAERRNQWLPSTASPQATLMATESRILPFCWCPPLIAFLLRCRFCWVSNSGTFSQGAALPVPPTCLPASSSGHGRGCSHQATGISILWLLTNVLNVFHGDGKGGFTPTGSLRCYYRAVRLLFADVNGDGNQDLIAAGGSSEVFIFLGNGDGTFQAPPGTPVSRSSC